ncbi:MAG: xanthine dehydrogenase family protein molybdopterin-binding subunit [Proteobacteria bacterium]|nr:xanthine dehydrogenase family protein molybdopterin-binding subunit [Pseudomonadota bacterium]MBI3498178.1 xanthine dehydrogenase family protein molybdopterin-binding subunit [Pseudomonadota bacterium]
MTAPSLPASLIENPALDRWIRFLADRTVRVATGKVELGQGIVTAIAQIAAEELDVPVDRIRVLSGDGAEGPDEVYTTGSQSIEVSGASVRLVCAEVRQRVLARLAQRLNCGRDELAVAEGRFFHNGTPTGHDYWSFAPEVDLESKITGRAATKPVAAYRLVGTSLPRLDLPAKLAGGAFIHDMVRPDMLHARVLRQPARGASLTRLDEAAICRAAGGELTILRLGEFVAFLGPDETTVQRAAMAAPAHAEWSNARRLDPASAEAAWLKSQISNDRLVGAPVPETPPNRPFEATYSRPYVAHASLAPSCALAEFRDGHLTIWSHGQGMHPLRRNVAAALGLAPDAVSAFHVQGAGCYGHNGADDAALDAAVIARAVPNRSIRLQWRREDEFGFEPLGSAMLITLKADLDESGRPQDWTTELWSGTHTQRPGTGGGNLLASEALPNPPPEPVPQDPPEASGGGATRNAVPLYDIPRHRILHHLVSRPPVRTSALCGLGALPNIFAIESFIDELALRLGEDPVAYRLSILSEPRARRVIETVARRADWAGRGPGGSGAGLGIGFARYKNRSAYAAVIAQVEVDESVRLQRIWCAADAGLAINPDGIMNQLEGGILQAASWTLKEQVRLDEGGIASISWASYPILRFSEVPELVIDLVEASEHPALGVGECTVGPTAAAIGNAVAHALGTRIRDMPLSRERIMAALLK